MGSPDGPDVAGRIVSNDAEPEQPRQAHRWLGLPWWAVVILGVFLSPFVLVGVLGGGLFVYIIASSDTVYSKGYSETSFKSLTVGMTTGEVEAVMGPPLSKEPWYEPDQETWSYSKQGGVNGIYYIRALYFKGGRLSQVQMELFYE
jgi:hypothetical protein